MRAYWMAFLAWAFTCGFAWLWWRYLTSAAIYSPGGRFTRADNPFNYKEFRDASAGRSLRIF